MTCKNLSIVTAAALTVGSLSFFTAAPVVRAEVPDAPIRTDNNANNNANRAVDRTGDRLDRTADKVDGTLNRNAPVDTNAMAPDASHINSVVAQVTEAAVKKGTFDDLVERLSEADRNRLGKDGFTEKDQPELDNLATSFQDAWKSKYGHAFSIDSSKVYTPSFVTVRESGTGRTSTGTMLHRDKVDPNGNTNTRSDTAANTGAEVTTKSDGTMTGPAGKAGGVDMTAAADQHATKDAKAGVGVRDDTTDRSNIAMRDSEANRTTKQDMAARPTNDAGKTADSASRETATAIIAASHGMPELQIPFVHEGMTKLTGWRIDLADNVDGPTLAKNLASHLTAIQSMQSQWPADENEGYRIVTHHILAAIQNVPVQMASGND